MLSKQIVYQIAENPTNFEIYRDEPSGVLTLFSNNEDGTYDSFRIGTADNLADLVDLLIAVQNEPENLVD